MGTGLKVEWVPSPGLADRGGSRPDGYTLHARVGEKVCGAVGRSAETLRWWAAANWDGEELMNAIGFEDGDVAMRAVEEALERRVSRASAG